MICPRCKEKHSDFGGWPLIIDGELREGGCQDCWEKECDELWWEQVEAIEWAHSELLARKVVRGWDLDISLPPLDASA